MWDGGVGHCLTRPCPQYCVCIDDCSSSNCMCGQLSMRCWYDKVSPRVSGGGAGGADWGPGRGQGGARAPGWGAGARAAALAWLEAAAGREGAAEAGTPPTLVWGSEAIIGGGGGLYWGEEGTWALRGGCWHRVVIRGDGASGSPKLEAQALWAGLPAPL